MQSAGLCIAWDTGGLIRDRTNENVPNGVSSDRAQARLRYEQGPSGRSYDVHGANLSDKNSGDELIGPSTIFC